MTGHIINDEPPHQCLAIVRAGGLWTICENQCEVCKTQESLKTI